jgi:hypothetical protein
MNLGLATALPVLRALGNAVFAASSCGTASPVSSSPLFRIKWSDRVNSKTRIALGQMQIRSVGGEEPCFAKGSARVHTALVSLGAAGMHRARYLVGPLFSVDGPWPKHGRHSVTFTRRPYTASSQDPQGYLTTAAHTRFGGRACIRTLPSLGSRCYACTDDCYWMSNLPQRSVQSWEDTSVSCELD